MAMASNGINPEKGPFERVDACIRDLQDRLERRYKSRRDYRYMIPRAPASKEAAMAGIVGELEGLLPCEELDMRSLTIFALTGISVKKGTPKEARLAYRAVGLLLLTLRDGSPGLLLDVAFPVLANGIQAAHDDDAATLVAAIDGLAAASFAGAGHVEEAMKAIWRVIVPPVRSQSAKLKIQAPKTSPVVLVSALSAWTFLLTTIVSATSTQRKADRNSWSSAAIASLMEILDADDRKVRMAAGEALAACVELNLLTGKHLDALAAKVSDLATESAGKGADNSLLRDQKELFGQIAAFLDHGEPPTTLVRRSRERQDVMKVSTWVRLVQLNFLSKFLGNGFLEHVQGNPLLNEAFSFGRVEGKPLSIQKKGSSMTTNEFLRGLKRDWLWFSKNVFMLEITRFWPQKLLQLGWQ
ncbi:unnamed protein product [Urochloa decumbens]|uniref:Interferon-related developmental regulator N-terminal domain-containing protein n=1 Tax=Urochloa decumbens TaxID=240449 RepID=A0ABC9CYJ5_9POAL